MDSSTVQYGLGTLVNHYAERDNPHGAMVAPIFQTSTFGFTDVDSGAEIFEGKSPGYIYGRLGNPNEQQFASKVAMLEAIDIARKQPQADLGSLAAGKTFASGMSAITTTILARVRSGETIIAQESLYSSTFNFLEDIATRAGIKLVWVKGTSVASWETAFRDHPDAVLAYAETPANPTMDVVPLETVAGLAHQRRCWLMVDNTFATPYCQRPLTLGADIVVHSATKYLSGHGIVIAGVVVSSHVDFIQDDLQHFRKTLGGSLSPFDAWLANIGLKTFELRMQRHCENAFRVARYLQDHPKVAKVHYPGLETHPGHAIANQQMHAYSGMLSFELKGGLGAGKRMMDRVGLVRLAVSLGNVESLIQHPASMTHSNVPREERLKTGISDGLVRFSVGIENVDDILADLGQALDQVGQ